MVTAKFEATVENGKIAIPEQYKGDFGQQANVEVILVKRVAPTSVSAEQDMIQYLLDNPLSVPDLVPAYRDSFYE